MSTGASAVVAAAVRNTAVRTVKQCAADMLYYSGLLQLCQSKFTRGQGLRILAYHRVSDSPFVLSGMSIKVSHFDRHLRHLVRHCTVLPLARAVEMIAKREKLPAGATVVTFDDGYKDNCANAWPLLKKYHIPATIFLSVEAIEEQNALWFDIVTEAFRTTKKNTFSAGRERAALPLRTVNERLAAAGITVEAGKRLPPRDRRQFVRRVLEELEVREEKLPLEQYMMDWGEITRMSRSGVAFGSHGMSHSILTNLSLPEREYEIGRSREIIQKRTGITVTAFAYPNGGSGDFSDNSRELLAGFGYATACTLVKGTNDCTIDRYALRRFCVTDGMGSGALGSFSAPLFAASLSGLYTG